MKVKLVVAVCKATRGIGSRAHCRGGCAATWRFSSSSRRVDDQSTGRNAVIMGRKTWQSIPEVPAAGGPAERGRESNAAARKEYAIPDGVLVASSLPGRRAVGRGRRRSRRGERLRDRRRVALPRGTGDAGVVREGAHHKRLPAEGRRARGSRGRCRLRVRRLLPRAPRGRLPARVTDGRSDGRHAMGHAAFLLRDVRRRLRRLRCPVGAPGGARQRSRGATVPESRPRRD